MRVESTTFTETKLREIAPNIFWIIGCGVGKLLDGSLVHVHNSCYLILGKHQALLFDTSQPAHWLGLEGHLNNLLGGLTLDFVVPSHPETAHSGNLGRLLRKYGGAVSIGDVRDYHMYFLHIADRLIPAAPGTQLDLGGGYVVTILDAPIKDLPNTVWGYEESQQVLFSADAFSFTHHPSIDEESAETPVHRPDECDLLSTELRAPPSVEQAAFVTKSALYWSRFVDIGPYLDKVAETLRRYPTRIVAPAHGNVITNVEQILPIVREVHRRAYGEMLAPDRTAH